MSSSNTFSFFILALFIISSLFSSSNVQALVPNSKTFKYVNAEESTSWMSLEYGTPSRPLPIQNHPFQLFFYATVINEGEIGYILGLAMVTSRGQGDRNLNDFFRWVWAANAGNQVHDNATLTFGADGNLVLAEADGRVVWETSTANRGVVDIKLLPNGNLVLVDKTGAFIWQSFNHPTDTLLVGQSLASSGNNNKLMSRMTVSDDTRGLFSMVLESKELAFYYNGDSRNNGSVPNKPSIYYRIPLPAEVDSALEPVTKEYKVLNMTLKHVSAKRPRPHTDLIQLEYFIDIDNTPRYVYLSQQKYNSSLSFLRLGWEGNLELYTLYDIDAYDNEFSSWEVTYTAITTDSYIDTCHLPEKCGSFGVCRNNQCTGCPTPRGIVGWSDGCKPSELPPCGINATSINFYKIEDVDHFSSEYETGEGPMKVGECKKKCSNDCKCVACFYNPETRNCLLTTKIGTLVNSSSPLPHLAFIKYQKKQTSAS